jgi:CRISPR/Cas system endoribonuclease Cas6 (RAMP superfamily)
MIAQTHGPAALRYDYKALLRRAEEVCTARSTLNLLSLERRSNRQDRKLDIDGFTGEISFSVENDYEFLPLLLAGEFLHVGSGTAFGLGRYEVGMGELPAL